MRVDRIGTVRARRRAEAVMLVDAVGEVHFDLIPGHGLGSMCTGMGEGVVLTPSWTQTTGLYEVRATRENGEVYTHLVAGESVELGWSVPCVDTVPDLRPREQLTIEVRSVDLLGRTGPWSEPLVASARAEEPGGCVTGGGSAGSLVLVGLSLGGLLRRAHRSRA
jgi:hypothetical protein